MKKIPQSKIYLFFILSLGIVLRLYKLGTNSLWGDEAIFVLFREIFSSGDFFESLKILWSFICKKGLGNANYGYLFFSTIWSCFAKSEFMLRFSSFIFGSFCIYFIYKVGKLFFDEKIGLVSAFIIAISPFHIYYSQEFRMYSLIPLLSLVAIYFLKRFLQTGRYKFLFIYVISNVLNFYMHIATILILFAQFFFFILCQKKYKTLFKKWIIGNLILILLIIPGAVYTVIELTWHKNIEMLFNITVSPVTEFGCTPLLLPIYTFKNFCIGYTATSSVWIPTLLLFSILFVWSALNIKDKEVLHLCLFCLFIPVIIMYIFRRFLYADRYLIPSSVFLYLIVSNGIACLRRTYALLALTLIIVLTIFSLNNLYKNYLPCPHKQRYAVHEKRACREAVAYIISNYQEGDIIFHTDINITLSFEYYFHYYFKQDKDRIVDKEKKGEGIGLILNFSEDGKDLLVFKSWAEPGRQLLKTSAPVHLLKTSVSVKGYKRVWLVFSAREFNEAFRPGSRENRILEYISNYYIRKDQKYFKGITLYLFENPHG